MADPINVVKTIDDIVDFIEKYTGDVKTDSGIAAFVEALENEIGQMDFPSLKVLQLSHILGGVTVLLTIKLSNQR